MILPDMEQTPIYNSFNFSLYAGNGYTSYAWATVWYTKIEAFQCPSDGKNDGFTPYGWSGTYSVTYPPPPPGNPSGARMVPTTNYNMSFGDNYAILPLSGANPWETYLGTPVPGMVQRGYPGYWGTNKKYQNEAGVMRGFADYSTGQVATIASVTDGTSNTIIVGEGLPWQDSNNEMYGFTGIASGTTLPINLYTGNPLPHSFGATVWTSRNSYAARGFKSQHPGGANFLFADGHAQFLKSTINPITYNMLGSRNGGEALAANSY